MKSFLFGSSDKVIRQFILDVETVLSIHDPVFFCYLKSTLHLIGRCVVRHPDPHRIRLPRKAENEPLVIRQAKLTFPADDPRKDRKSIFVLSK